MERLPLTTQTLYAELIEHLIASDATRTIGNLPGCFIFKKIKEKNYCYFQISDPGGAKRQIYVGIADDKTFKVVNEFNESRSSLLSEHYDISVLCSQLRIAGINVTDAESGRVLKAFSDSGFFKAGGILIGTHAYSIIGNLLGIKWDKTFMKTQDIDIAGYSKLEIALSDISIDIPDTIENLKMGFVPIPKLNNKHPSTSFKIRGKELRVDVLTPAKRPDQTEPIFINRFKIAAQPLMFLDYLLEDTVQAAAVDGGGVLVSIPNPARYALHKLIISGERQVTQGIKASKDILQAASIIEVLLEDRPGDIQIALAAIEKRGKGWIKKLKNGLTRMMDEHPVSDKDLFDKYLYSG